MLAATQQVWPDKLEDALFVGELSLEGTTRHTKGILPLAALALLVSGAYYFRRMEKTFADVV